MILQKEISKIAEQSGVLKSVVDKDWVLGHFIAAMITEPDITHNLIFKGGTCLRKCWIPDYRFSEDLDFTASSSGYEFTLEQLMVICDKVISHSGIQLHIDSLKPLNSKNKKVGYESYVKYWGADHSKNRPPPPPARWNTRIKIEIILYEKMIFDPVYREIYHPYSDNLGSEGHIPCYQIEEVLSEKLRALVQRSYSAPRDYYDIWYLSNHIPNLDWAGIRNAFFEKMAFKNLEFKGVDQLVNPRSIRAVNSAWNSSLNHQVKHGDLPEFDEIRNQLEKLLNRIFT